MTVIRSNLFNLLQEIEKRNNRKYPWAVISRRIQRSRQATEALFMGEQSKDSYIKYGTMGHLLEFFRAEGLDIGPGDLFVVTEQPQP